MTNWRRIDDILQSADRTVLGGIAVAHTLTAPQFIELGDLLLDAQYEAEAAERRRREHCEPTKDES